MEFGNPSGNVNDMKFPTGKLNYITHRGGKKSTTFSLERDFTGLIFTGELSGLDSTGIQTECYEEAVRII